MSKSVTHLTAYLDAQREAFIADLADLVNRDCGTDDKLGVDRVARWFERRCADWGYAVQTLPQTHFGDNVVGRIKGTGKAHLMLIGHLDTVYPIGTAAARPMRIVGDKIIGPGTCDIKGGLLVGLYAVRALQHMGFADFDELVFFFNSEEEVGSPVSQHLYAPIAKSMDAVLVLEAARANGDIVSARKGVGNYKLRVRGKAAHAGVEPEKGSSAILELAHRIAALHAINGVAPGVTVNAGVIGGGTRPNVVPDEAWVDVDVRAVDPQGAMLAQQAITNLARQPSQVRGTSIEMSGSFGFMPMAKTAPIARLVALTQASARELGFEVNDAATGGVSDANKMAELGVPVLDGLGPVGGLDHGPDEYIELSSIVPRTALLALLIQKIASVQS
jgi:glutamate carboxypeptidase